MKLNTSRTALIIGMFVFCIICIPSVVYAQNTITGTVFTDQRRPATDVDVELLDEFERFIKSTKTRGGGLYTFNNLRSGVFYISVRTNGSNLEAPRERVFLGETNVTVSNGTGGSRTSGVDVQQVNIYLQVNPRLKRPNLSNEVLFAQEIPEEAKSAYEKGLKYANDEKADLATAEFLKATEIFPDYYLALMDLGNSYLNAKLYEKSADIFDRAIKVNNKSYHAFFGLAVSQNSLNKKADAETNLIKAVEINADNVAYHLLLGIIQRDLQKYTDAETSFLKAKKLSDNKEPDVHWNLALLYFNDLKRFTEAADELELYIKAAPTMPKAKKTETKNLIKALRLKAKEA